MNQINTIVESDERGVLHLNVSSVPPRRRMRVVVTWTPVEETPKEKRAALEALAGSLADAPLEQPEPGMFLEPV